MRLCLTKALPLTCAIVSNHFYDLPVLASFVYSLLPHLVKSRSSSSLSEWRLHHLVSIHLLIAAGYGYHLGLALYLAFIMHLPFKGGLRKEHCQPSLQPPQNFCMILHQHSQEIKLAHQRKGQATRRVSARGRFLYYYDYVSTRCPLPSVLLEPAHLGVP